MIRAEGPEKAKIMIIGEAWGAAEEKAKAPFKGMAGKVLDGILEEVGIPRGMCRITNVVHRRPPGNNFGVFYDKKSGKKVPTPELAEAYERLKNEIASCQPNVIVPLGNEAMKAVAGLNGIMDWRGSTLSTSLGKVIPTIHPAAIYRKWTLRPASVSDFTRIAEQSEFPEVKETERTLIINPTFEEVLHEIEEAEKAKAVAFDIEVESEQITCIGLSHRLHRAICIPFWWGASGSFFSEDQESQIWDALRGLLESKEGSVKVAHNGAYDIEYLYTTVGIFPKLGFDTMLGFHTLYSELPKSLGFLVSLYTDHPFYKYQRKTDSMSEYFKYNATDACLTLECYYAIDRELNESGLKPFYLNFVHSLIEPLLGMQLRGVRFDSEKRNRLRKQFREKISRLQIELEELVGHPLNVGSHQQMTKWLYKELKLPKKYKKDRQTGRRSLTANEEALNELKIKAEGKAKEALKKVLEIRERNKILSTYLNVKLDSDKRLRCSYLVTGTETGRLSSRKTARGTGNNLQNIPAGVVKELLIADEGKTLINADLSQAEARVVAYVSGEERLRELFESGGDIHRRNAANIYGIKEEEVNSEQRDLAKRVVHASNYGMGPRTFARTAGIPESEAKRLLNQYFAQYPRLKRWHLQVASDLKKFRRLTTPLGRTRIFFNRWSESLTKEGLAYIPQATVADIVNQGLVRLHDEGFEILLQVHDSIVVQCDDTKEKIRHTVKRMRKAMTEPVVLNGKVMTIPVEFKIGYNWNDMKEISDT